MVNLMDNLLVAQSGGPTAVINATLVGILQGIRINNKVDRVYGAKNGIEGVFKEEFINLNELVNDPFELDILKYTPSSALGTCRYKLKDWNDDEESYKILTDIFCKYEIKYFIYIGGNDSMDTVCKLSDYCIKNKLDIVIVGAPKTIDNDLELTDHCPGFGSAAKYIATTIAELERDTASYDLPAVTIVEIMGRNAGWLTASSALARLNGGVGPDLIYLCEREFSIEGFIRDVREVLERKPDVLVTISEGIKDKKGIYISDQTSSKVLDGFGHKYIAGAAKVLEKLVIDDIGCKTRTVELSLMQRASAHIASDTDVNESVQLGHKALTCALNGETGRMVAIKRLGDEPYRIEYISVPVEMVANHEKKVPLQWITEDGHNVTKDMISYLKPLIQGEAQIKYKNGIPRQTIVL